LLLNLGRPVAAARPLLLNLKRARRRVRRTWADGGYAGKLLLSHDHPHDAPPDQPRLRLRNRRPLPIVAVTASILPLTD
jgi:hypothetical protein